MKSLTFHILLLGVGCFLFLLPLNLTAQEATLSEQKLEDSLSTPLSISSADVLEYRDFSYLVQDQSATILTYTGSKSSLSIPTTINEFPVTAIASRAFINNPRLRSVSIPESITQIGEAAFAACPKLRTIQVSPDNPAYSSVDGVLFSKDLTTLLQCPAARKDAYSVPLGTKVLAGYSFMFCQNLTLIILPEGITQIGDRAFEKTSITQIELPSSLQTLGHYVFASCDLLQKIRVPDQCQAVINAQSIGQDSKADVTRWKYDDSGNIIAIEGYTVGGQFPLEDAHFVIQEGDILSDRQGLVYSIMNESEVAIIGYKYKYPAGKGSKKKTSRRKYEGKALVIPSVLEGYPVTSIAPKAFFCSYHLEGVVIPDSIVSIGESAFMYCNALTNVVIPPNATNIDFGAFRNCNSLTNILITGNKLSNLGAYAFSGCSNLTSVSLPNSVLTINEGVFKNCTSLQGITSGINLTNISEAAFEGCTSLRSIFISDNLTTLKETFETCSALEFFEVSPDNPSFSDQEGVLYDKAQTALIRFPRANRDESLMDSADRDNLPLLQSYTVPNTVTNIGTFAFSRSPGLTNIVLPPGLQKIEPHAFYFCTNLVQMIVPDKIPSLAPGVFSRCTSLSGVELGPEIKRIYSSAFSTCNNLTRMYFKGNAPLNSDLFLDDWHRVTIYRLENSTGWDTFPWKNKAKRYWELDSHPILPPVLREALPAEPLPEVIDATSSAKKHPAPESQPLPETTTQAPTQ